jgi:integrase
MKTKKPKRVKLTKRTIEAMPSPATGRIYVYDSQTAGFCICLTAAGGRTFYHYRKQNGKPERKPLGKFPATTIEEARDEADRENGKIAEGDNPADKRRVNRSSPTLGEVFDEFIVAPTRSKAKRPRAAKTVEDYRLQFNKHLGHWRNRKLATITRKDVEKLHNDIGDGSGTYIANRVLSLVKALFNHAIDEGYFPTNPANRLRAFEEQSRERYLTAEELPAFIKAVEAEPLWCDFFKVLLFTGARCGNVKAMRWADVNLVTATWKIPNTKNQKPLTVALAPQVVEILKRRKQLVSVTSSDWVFPDSTGRHAIRSPKHAWDRITKAAGCEDLRIHDLRRSLGSWQAALGSSLTVIGKSLGHESLAATKVYARVDLATVRLSVDAAAAAMVEASKAKEGTNNE